MSNIKRVLVLLLVASPFVLGAIVQSVIAPEIEKAIEYRKANGIKALQSRPNSY